MDWMVNENENPNIIQLLKEEPLGDDFNEPHEQKLDPEDVEMKYETSMNEEFDIKDEFNVSDVDSDHENDQAKKSEENTSTADTSVNLPKEDLTTLINRIELALPDKDKLAYNTRVEKLNWDDVKFKEYTSADCKKTWLLIQKRLRRFRLLSEVLQDAKEWVLKPWTDYYRRKQTKNCPGMPRRPVSAYMIFYLKMKEELLEKNPDLEMPEVTKEISQIYKNLPSEERKKYTNLALTEKKIYDEKLEEFYRIHPEIPRQTEKSLRAKKPSTPFYLFYSHQLKDPDLDNNTFKEECKKQWKSLPDKEKLVWINSALDNEAKYQDELKAYMVHNPDFTPPVLKPILTKEEKSLKERLAGKPVKPPSSSYSLFTAMMLQSEQIKKIPPKERMKAVADEWKNSSDEDKKPFQERVNELMKQYKEELALYLGSLPDCKREEEIQNMPKRKNKNVDKNDKIPEKKKKSNEEVNLETSIDVETPQTPKSNISLSASTPEEPSPIKTRNPEETRAVPKKKDENVEKTEKTPKKKKKTNEVPLETISIPESSQPPLSHSSTHKDPSPIRTEIQEEAQSLPKMKTKNVQKSDKVPVKKKKLNAEVNKTEKVAEKKKKLNPEDSFQKILKSEPPQPPLSGFALFTSLYKGPLSIKKAWKILSKQEKETYEENVEKMKQKYIVEYENFLKSLPKEQLLAFSKLKHKGNADRHEEEVIEASSDSDISHSEDE